MTFHIDLDKVDILAEIQRVERDALNRDVDRLERLIDAGRAETRPPVVFSSLDDRNVEACFGRFVGEGDAVLLDVRWYG